MKAARRTKSKRRPGRPERPPTVVVSARVPKSKSKKFKEELKKMARAACK